MEFAFELALALGADGLVDQDGVRPALLLDGLAVGQGRILQLVGGAEGAGLFAGGMLVRHVALRGPAMRDRARKAGAGWFVPVARTATRLTGGLRRGSCPPCLPASPVSSRASRR